MPLPTASRTCWLSAALALALSSAAHAAEPAFDLAAVVVTATRQATRANEIIADVTVIDREAIEQAGPTTLPGLLARQPGLHMVENGGMGKSASIFLRGTGTGHTLLLVDGVPLGSVTSGNPSLHNLPLSQIERIEILRGPASSLYGSDAIGGVIQVFTRRGEGEGRLNAYAGIGSHATRELQGGISGGSSGWSYNLGLSRLTTDGVSVAADPVRYRIASGSVPNADADGYGNSAVSARLAYTFAPGHELGATLLEASSRNAFDGGGLTVDAYNRDKTLARSVYLRNRLNEIWTSTLRWGLSEDNSSSFAPARSQFATSQTQWTWQNDLRLPLGALLLALENTDQAVTSTTNYAVKTRNVRSLVIGYQGQLGAHSWQAAARYDRNSQFGGRRTGSFGYGYRFATEWQARMSHGHGFQGAQLQPVVLPGLRQRDLAARIRTQPRSRPELGTWPAARNPDLVRQPHRQPDRRHHGGGEYRQGTHHRHQPGLWQPSRRLERRRQPRPDAAHRQHQWQPPATTSGADAEAGAGLFPRRLESRR
jgi:vitamin B12 transporter